MVNWWQKLRNKSAGASKDPRAQHVVALGNHIENLNNHAPVRLEPCGTLEELDLPIWVHVSSHDKTEQTYENLLWEIEPTGEYVYYLAGDFPKNDKGLLRYASAKTRIEVYVSYEDDAVEVRKFDELNYAQHANQSAQDHTDFAEMTVQETWALLRERTRTTGYDQSFINLLDNRAQTGWCYARCGASYHKTPMFLINCTILDETGDLPRLTILELWSTDGNQKIGPLCEVALSLLKKYSAIAHHELSGAIRM